MILVIIGLSESAPHTPICLRRLLGLTGIVVGHRSIAPGFKPWLGYVRRVFHLLLCLITLGGRSAHLAYHVRKRYCKTATRFPQYISPAHDARCKDQ